MQTDNHKAKFPEFQLTLTVSNIFHDSVKRDEIGEDSARSVRKKFLQTKAWEPAEYHKTDTDNWIQKQVYPDHRKLFNEN